MEIPKTTTEKPFIEFQFNKNGKLMKLSISSIWWGGKNHSFFSSDGMEGNTCRPEDLDDYILVYKKRKINQLKKDIISLQKQLDKLTTQFEYK